MRPDWPNCQCPAYPVPHPIGMGRCLEPVPAEPVAVAEAFAAAGRMAELERRRLGLDPPSSPGAVRFELWRTADEQLIDVQLVYAPWLETDDGGYADWFPEYDLRDPRYPYGYPDGYEWRASYPNGEQRRQAADAQIQRWSKP